MLLVLQSSSAYFLWWWFWTNMTTRKWQIWLHILLHCFLSFCSSYLKGNKMVLLILILVLIRDQILYNFLQVKKLWAFRTTRFTMIVLNESEIAGTFYHYFKAFTWTFSLFKIIFPDEDMPEAFYVLIEFFFSFCLGFFFPKEKKQMNW